MRLTFLAILLACSAMARAEDTPPTLAIGAQAPDFSLPAVGGKTYRLQDFAASKVLVIVFTCVHCPTAQLYEGRIQKLAVDYRDRGVALVAIQPNNPKAVRLDELGYTDLADSLPEMEARAAYRHFDFPFLYDGETQSVARAYGPTATPHVFVFDAERKLRYQGRVDSSQREALAKRQDARTAIDAVLDNKPVALEKTPTVGCSIKWAYKTASGEDEMVRIEKEPVNVELAGVDELKALRKNSTGKVLLVNFWATWCGPCTAEFPEFQKMYRMYRRRAFELVTVSANFPDEKKGVLKFLLQQHASTRNLLFGTNETYDEMAAFDPEWNAGVPYTMLIGIDGHTIYKKQGEIEPLEVRRLILANLPDDDYLGQQGVLEIALDRRHVAAILVLDIKSGTIPFSPNMPIYQVIVLACVQGLTEFLPVSSTAHLYLTSWLLGWKTESLTFDIALHLGTLLAVLVYFFRDWMQIIGHGFGMRHGRDEELERNRGLLWLLAIGTIPVGIAGLLFSKQAEGAWRNPLVIGIMLVVIGVLMGMAERSGRRTRDIAGVNFLDAVAIGIAQALAVVPGVSRSGITITAGLFRNLNRKTAARFSFLLSTPAIAAAAGKATYDLIKHKAFEPGMQTAFALGIAISAITGFIVIAWFLRFVRRRSLWFFVFYRIVFGIIVLALALFRRPAG